MMSFLKRHSAWLVLACLLSILIVDFSEINSRFLGSDASQNLRSALNFLHHGIYSEAPLGDSVIPGYRREPVPNLVLGTYLGVLSKVIPSFDYQSFPENPALVMMSKWINLGYVVALFVSIWLLLRRLIASSFSADLLAIPLFYLVNHFFVASQLNNLNTELPAALFLVWISLGLILAEQSRNWFWICFSGVCFGLLVLTKAIGAYVGLIAIPVLSLCISNCHEMRKYFKVLALFSLGFMLTVMPWVVRNYSEFDRPVVAQGAGDVLLIRSAFNTMNNQEFAQSFYVYAPKAIRDKVLGPLMGLSQDDLACGKTLDRFNRSLDCDKVAIKEERYNDVRSFYQIGKRALPRSMGLKREQKQSEAVSRILADPKRHTVVSLPLGWRGLWSFGSRISPSAVVLNIMAYLALFIAPVLAVIQKRVVWVYLSLVPLGNYLFYAFFTHFLPRYSEPIIPMAMICLLLMLVDYSARIFPSAPVRLRF